MPRIFHPFTNSLAKVSILGAGFILAFLLWIAMMFVRSPYATGVDVVVQQPIQFSHDHHVRQIGIDCRYCHTSVEDSSFAGIPATEVCMNCHQELFRDSPMLEPIRESFRTGRPVYWNRVHELPDFVYFDHSIHLHAGIGCSTCHGRVDRMPLMRREHTLQMRWCLECHRNPERYVRPREEVFNMEWPPPHWPAGDAAAPADGSSDTDGSEPGELAIGPGYHGARDLDQLGRYLVDQYDIRRKTSCSICHR